MPPILIFLFLCMLAVLLTASAVGFNYLESQRKKQVEGMLRSVEGLSEEEEIQTSILIDNSQDSVISRRLQSMAKLLDIKMKIQQAGLDWTVSGFFLATAIAAGIGAFLGWTINPLLIKMISLLGVTIACGALPYAFLMYKRSQRLSAFEEQFPEALDFLARSMRAGHAFSVSLEMIGAESPDPLGAEFRTLFNEQNLGSPLEVAFANMLRRLPLIDVRFFVSSVMLQRQTGGNLSEILVRLSYVIRERFRLRGQVKAASAHGRMTAGVLVLMPIVLTLALLFIAPGYLQEMANDPDGKWLIVASLVAQLFGFYFIRKIINIKV
jgi:tight adherence protein B